MPLQKLCCKCRTLKDAEHFYANKRVKDGLNSFCILCHKADSIARKKRNRSDAAFKAVEAANKKEYRAKTRDAHKSYMRLWHAKNAVDQIEYRAKYRTENPDYFAEYAKNNRAKITAKTRHRQAAVLNRTPCWLTKDDAWVMQQAYELAALRTKMFGFDWHVDHVIPLLGKRVSGLHVPTNLQVIPAKDNLRKNNKFEV
jgi:hypothetical protein